MAVLGREEGEEGQEKQKARANVVNEQDVVVKELSDETKDTHAEGRKRRGNGGE